jgi:hypothetical protein
MPKNLRFSFDHPACGVLDARPSASQSTPKINFLPNSRLYEKTT